MFCVCVWSVCVWGGSVVCMLVCGCVGDIVSSVGQTLETKVKHR